MTTTERVLMAATPVVTLVGLVGLGYPPYAALTRWRICHQPKNGARKLSYWQVVKDVNKKEGKWGFYKGLLVHLSTGVAPWATVLAGYGVLRLFPKAAPYVLVGTVAQMGWQVLTTLVTLPLEILAVRTLSTPHLFSITTPRTTLRLLLTADERSHPLRSLYTPSRFIASFIPTILSPLSAIFLLPQFLKLGEQNGLIAYLVSQIAIAGLIRTPLAVLAARLNAQRTGGTGAAIVHEKGQESAELEGVVQVRPTPYRNILDAVRTMVAEEGWYSLWRGWPLEVLLAIRNHL